jgi:hypothetical protein
VHVLFHVVSVQRRIGFGDPLTLSLFRSVLAQKSMKWDQMQRKRYGEKVTSTWAKDHGDMNEQSVLKR